MKSHSGIKLVPREFLPRMQREEFHSEVKFCLKKKKTLAEYENIIIKFLLSQLLNLDS